MRYKRQPVERFCLDGVLVLHSRFRTSHCSSQLPQNGSSSAQQIVHALTGKVTAVCPASKIIEIDTDDGSQGSFDVLTQNVPMTFEKNVKAMTVPASSFNKAAINVVVFYFGQEGARTIVAVEDLGSRPLVKPSARCLAGSVFE